MIGVAAAYHKHTDTPNTSAAFEGIAESKKAALTFKGIAFGSERPEIAHQLPDGGVDIQGELVYWALPCGRCVCWALRELANAHGNDLAPTDSDEACRAVTRELGYDVLACPTSEPGPRLGVLRKSRFVDYMY